MGLEGSSKPWFMQQICAVRSLCGRQYTDRAHVKASKALDPGVFSTSREEWVGERADVETSGKGV